MPPLSNVLSFALAAALIIAIPGPSVLFVVARSLAHGRAGGLLSVVGNLLGEAFQVAAVALGLGALIAESILLFTLVKFVGAAYLIYLGVQTIRHRMEGTSVQTVVPLRPTRRLLIESFMVGLTNPKSIVFFVAVLPQFVDYSAGSVPLQLAVLGTVFLVIALVFDSTWALAAGMTRDWFGRSPKRLARMRATGGVTMVGLGGTLALTGHQPS